MAEKSTIPAGAPRSDWGHEQITAGKMDENEPLAEAIRRTAYFLWEQDGRPEGQSFQYWLRAKDMHLRQLAYDKWLAEGTPVGRAEAHWRDAAGEIED